MGRILWAMSHRRPAFPLTRRQALAGLGAVGLCALQAGPVRSDASTRAARFGLGDLSSVALREVGTPASLDALAPERSLPPASVLKVMTTLYALDALGPAHRFRTELRALGAIEGDTLRGGLVLVGGGDPVLDANALRGLAASLAETGLTQIEGPFLVADGRCPSSPRLTRPNRCTSATTRRFRG